jgi:hypothetical protein
MVKFPIACTLTHEEMAKVKEEYRASQHLYRAMARIEGSAAVIDLEGDTAPLGRFLRTMVAREEKCCAFLTFDLSETADGFRLRLGSGELNPQALSLFVEMLFPSLVLEI